MTARQKLFIDIRHELDKLMNFQTEMDVKGVGYIGEMKNLWDLKEECARNIIKLLPKK
jgi:hypothetical protein